MFTTTTMAHGITWTGTISNADDIVMSDELVITNDYDTTFSFSVNIARDEINFTEFVQRQMLWPLLGHIWQGLDVLNFNPLKGTIISQGIEFNVIFNMNDLVIYKGDYEMLYDLNEPLSPIDDMIEFATTKYIEHLGPKHVPFFFGADEYEFLCCLVGVLSVRERENKCSIAFSTNDARDYARLQLENWIGEDCYASANYHYYLEDKRLVIVPKV